MAAARIGFGHRGDRAPSAPEPQCRLLQAQLHQQQRPSPAPTFAQQEQPLAGPWSRELLTDRCEPGLVQNADLQVGTQVSYETSAPSKRAPKEQTPKEQREHLVTDLLRHRPAARDYVHRPAPTIGFAVTGRKQAPLEVGDRHDERASSVPQVLVQDFERLHTSSSGASSSSTSSGGALMSSTSRGAVEHGGGGHQHGPAAPAARPRPSPRPGPPTPIGPQTAISSRPQTGAISSRLARMDRERCRAEEKLRLARVGAAAGAVGVHQLQGAGGGRGGGPPPPGGSYASTGDCGGGSRNGAAGCKSADALSQPIVASGHLHYDVKTKRGTNERSTCSGVVLNNRKGAVTSTKMTTSGVTTARRCGPGGVAAHSRNDSTSAPRHQIRSKRTSSQVHRIPDHDPGVTQLPTRVRRALQVVFMLLVLSLGLDPSSWGFFGWLGRSAEKKAAIAFSRRGRRTAAGGTMDEREQQEDNEGETGRTGGWAAGDDEGETAFSALLQVGPRQSSSASNYAFGETPENSPKTSPRRSLRGSMGVPPPPTAHLQEEAGLEDSEVLEKTSSTSPPPSSHPVLEHYVVPATLRCYSFAYYHYQNSTAVLYLAVLLSGAVAGIGLLAFLFSAWQLFCIFALGRTRPTERKIDPQAARKSSFYDSTQKFASSPAVLNEGGRGGDERPDLQPPMDVAENQKIFTGWRLPWPFASATPCRSPNKQGSKTRWSNNKRPFLLSRSTFPFLFYSEDRDGERSSGRARGANDARDEKERLLHPADHSNSSGDEALGDEESESEDEGSFADWSAPVDVRLESNQQETSGLFTTEQQETSGLFTTQQVVVVGRRAAAEMGQRAPRGRSETNPRSLTAMEHAEDQLQRPRRSASAFPTAGAGGSDSLLASPEFLGREEDDRSMGFSDSEDSDPQTECDRLQHPSAGDRESRTPRTDSRFETVRDNVADKDENAESEGARLDQPQNFRKSDYPSFVNQDGMLSEVKGLSLGIMVTPRLGNKGNRRGGNKQAARAAAADRLQTASSRRVEAMQESSKKISHWVSSHNSSQHPRHEESLNNAVLPVRNARTSVPGSPGINRGSPGNRGSRTPGQGGSYGFEAWQPDENSHSTPADGVRGVGRGDPVSSGVGEAGGGRKKSKTRSSNIKTKEKAKKRGAGGECEAEVAAGAAGKSSSPGKSGGPRDVGGDVLQGYTGGTTSVAVAPWNSVTRVVREMQ
eukprot:CAMPEP_0179004128 /NCGR_PEP_ID=MMETSP0795-20121207/13103_1 /TAXON_ID=88552 /ORGANISM="Amoebophrya sp., Strain Ameob2" /LENGTH=1209 /DNA_ID=CAMNT_0020698297 /DNA_START=200 /DNA_END=3829 /DNA_ORIENTATION=-